MKYLNGGFDFGAETGADNIPSVALMEARLHAIEERLNELAQGDSMRATLHKEASLLLLGLERNKEAWDRARPLFEPYIEQQQWEAAVEVCDVCFRADQEGSTSALGQGVWLAVTFPVDPELTVAMLQHIVDETPDDSDGAAVAAAAAKYVVDLRAEGKQYDDLNFFAVQMLGTVARRHSNVDTQAQFDAWLAKLELSEPEKFLVRLRNVIDVMVQNDWWFDRDAVQATLPVN